MVNTRYTTRHNLPEYRKSGDEKPCGGGIYLGMTGGVIPCKYPDKKYQDRQNVQCSPKKNTSEASLQKPNKKTAHFNGSVSEQNDMVDITNKKANVQSVHFHFYTDHSTDNDQEYVFVK